MLFFSRKKQTAPPDFSWLKCDMHSHLVPGIDDGARELTDSLEMIRGLVELGYQKLVTTPHILWEMYPNTPDKITMGMENVRRAVAEAGLDVELHAAAEYFIDDHFDAELQKKAPLLPISGNMVLVEFSMLTAPMELKQVLFEMEIQNYQPVIAHPERYSYLSRNKEFYDDLKDAGCWFQLNLLSLTGYYGPLVKDLSDYLLKKGYYDLAGTDLHSMKHLEGLKRITEPQMKKLQDSGNIKNQML